MNNLDEHHEDIAAGAGQAPQPRKSPAVAWLRELLETLLPAAVIAIFINLFLAQSTVVLGQSMESNLHPNQRLVVEKVSYALHAPRRGDIVVIKPRRPDETIPLIKRVVALAGETIEIHGGQVYVDGKALDEPYLHQKTSGDMAPLVVPPLHIFVMGDNRAASNDSRFFGPVPIKDVIGRAWISYWPPSELRVLE